MGEQALQVGVVIPPHTFCWWEYEGRCPEAGGHENVTVDFAAVLVPNNFPNKLPPLLLVDLKSLLLGFTGAGLQ